LEKYSSELRDLAMKILLLMAKPLKMDTKDVMELFDGGRQALRMNYYPPCPRPELVIGLTPHSDASALTILLQVNEMEGLQIKTEGKWVPVKPLPNAFVVNVGDILEVKLFDWPYICCLMWNATKFCLICEPVLLDSCAIDDKNVIPFRICTTFLFMLYGGKKALD